MVDSGLMMVVDINLRSCMDDSYIKILDVAGLTVNRLHSTSLSTMSQQSDCFEANNIKLEAKVSHKHSMEVGYMLLLWSPGCGNLDKNKRK